MIRVRARQGRLPIAFDGLRVLRSLKTLLGILPVMPYIL